MSRGESAILRFAMKATERHKLIDRIKTLEGLTDDERSALLGLLRESKTYGLVWEDKPEEVEERLRTELPVLKEVTSRAIISDKPDTPNHILIEGDNLEALTTLAYTHEGKIDVIYIDPPYNTGNKDFVYNDDYVDNDDDYRHSKWLSMMKRRLKIAKKLLKDTGFIFLSIDDNEQANLKILCDEIFGSKNFKSNSIIMNNRGGRDYGGVALQHDYILIYSKSIGQLNLINDSDKEFPFRDKLGGFSLMELRNRNVKFNIDNRPNLCYPFYVDPTHPDENGLLHISLEPFEGSIEVYPAKSNGIQTVWRWGKEEKSRKNLNIEIFGKANRNGGYMIVQKYRKTTKMQRSIWDEKEFFNERGSEVLKEILTQNIFSYPKSVVTIKRVLELGSQEGSTILDFFAGSGTTLHAVMQLNAEDGGTRQCILCTNNENGICENVTYERNKRVIEGYTKPNGEFVEGLHDNNLRYYRTDFVGRSRSMRNMQRLVNLSTDMLCIKENLYIEQKEMAGMKTHSQIFRFFDDGKKQMLIIYREEYIGQIVELIEKMEVRHKMKVYVFSPSDDPATELFDPVSDKVDPTALPAAIYNTYKRILPKKPDRLIDGEEDALALTSEEEIGGLFGENEIIDEVASGTKERGQE